jgi:hypothetical protein
MTDASLSDDRFMWHHSPKPGNPWRVTPRINGSGDCVVSYRRCLTLLQWCHEQFSHERTKIENQSASFLTESEMILFVTFWSGSSIDRMTIEQIEKKKPLGF